MISNYRCNQQQYKLQVKHNIFIKIGARMELQVVKHYHIMHVLIYVINNVIHNFLNLVNVCILGLILVLPVGLIFHLALILTHLLKKIYGLCVPVPNYNLFFNKLVKLGKVGFHKCILAIIGEYSDNFLANFQVTNNIKYR